MSFIIIIIVYNESLPAGRTVVRLMAGMPQGLVVLPQQPAGSQGLT